MKYTRENAWLFKLMTYELENHPYKRRVYVHIIKQISEEMNVTRERVEKFFPFHEFMEKYGDSWCNGMKIKSIIKNLLTNRLRYEQEASKLLEFIIF